jgi:hypothetical protein
VLGTSANRNQFDFIIIWLYIFKMPTARPIYVAPYAEALIRPYLPELGPPLGRYVRNDSGDTEVVIYGLEDVPALKAAAEKAELVLESNEASENDGDKRQIFILLGTLSVHEGIEFAYPYPEQS